MYYFLKWYNNFVHIIYMFAILGSDGDCGCDDKTRCVAIVSANEYIFFLFVFSIVRTLYTVSCNVNFLLLCFVLQYMTLTQWNSLEKERGNVYKNQMLKKSIYGTKSMWNVSLCMQSACVFSVKSFSHQS